MRLKEIAEQKEMAKLRDPNWKTLQAKRTSSAAGAHKDKKKAAKQGDVKHKNKEVAEARDPEDWDEGNTEPPNNFAVYINGKKWKVFRGRGTYADDQRERAHYRQLQDWAAKKSAATGKQWSVHVTGEPATE
jgi:hypothetical protein